MGVSITLQSTNFSANHSVKKLKIGGIILTNERGKNAQNCINIHSNCIIMQFWEGWLLMGSGALVVGRYAKLKPKKLESHPDNCNFAPWWVLLCTPKDATLHLDGCFFAWLPPLICLEAKSSTFFFLILNELHSAAENFTFLTKTNYIPYENTLHSLLEYTSFS